MAIATLTFLLGVEIVAFWNLDASFQDQIVGSGALTRMAVGFGAGCLLWVLHRRLPDASLVTNDLLLLGCCTATAVALLAFPPVCGVPLLTALVHCAARPGPRTEQVLGHPIALFMGRISFALYLSHLLVIKVVLLVTNVISFGQPSHSWEFRSVGTLIAGISGIGVATVLCLLIEEPARRFGRKSVSRVMAVSAAAD